MTKTEFNYDAAFSRNLGVVQPFEQQKLRQSCVAIAGLGGVGGAHVVALARLGIGSFHLADFDAFEIVNFNRQAGAMVSTLGQPKSQVMQKMAQDINPEASVKIWEAITQENIGAFLQNVDVVVDGLDFFAIQAREILDRKSVV